MARYSYHNRTKQRIRNGELAGILEESGEPFALRFVFTDGTTRPIRPYRVAEYLLLKPVCELLGRAAGCVGVQETPGKS